MREVFLVVLVVLLSISMSQLIDVESAERLVIELDRKKMQLEIDSGVCCDSGSVLMDRPYSLR